MKANMKMDLKYCSGCGSLLQTVQVNEPGYVKEMLNQEYCMRCFKLKNYGTVINYDVDINIFKNKIIDIINDKEKNNRFFYIVDALDIKGTRMYDIEELLRNSETIICVNKIDIFPKTKDKFKIYDYCIEEFKDSKILNKKITLVSSKMLDTIDNLLSIINDGNYNNYFIGMSNTGKSSLINACLKQRNKEEHIVTSRFTNTTLDIMNVNLGIENNVFDTPGISVSKSIINSIDYSEWNKFVFKKELKQYTFQVNGSNSIVYENLAWIDIIDNSNEKNSFHIWTNNNINVHRTKTKNVREYLSKGNLIKPLENSFVEEIFSFDKEDNLSIVISGLGWISFKSKNGLSIRVNVPKNNDKILVYITNNNI